MRSMLTGAVVGVGSIIILIPLMQVGVAQVPPTCSSMSTPLQCYEAGLSQVGAALGELRKIEADLNQKLEALKAENAQLRASSVTRNAVIEKKADDAVRQIKDTAIDAEKKIKTLRDNTNETLSKLRSFDAAQVLGFDIQDGSYHAGRPHSQDCGGGRFISGIITYIEDGHIKMAFQCRALKELQVP
jgi:chaperonin cofactor prefoldin